jgi:hypothetical protein
MLYFITDILLKVALSSNKTGHHVIRYNWRIIKVALNTNKTDHHVIHYYWHIVESGAKH